MKKTIIAYLMSALALLSCSGLFAQEVQAGVDKTTVVLGDYAVYRIRAKDITSPDTPELKGIKNCKVKFLGRKNTGVSSFTVVVNGKTVKDEQSNGDTIFEYSVEPEQLGEMTIPEQELFYGDKKFTTPAFTLYVVGAPEKSDEVFARLTTDSTRIYAGQPIAVTIEWFVSRDINNYSISVPWLTGADNFIVSDPDTENDTGAQLTTLAVNGQTPTVWSRTQQSFANRKYTVFTTRKIINPITPGPLTLKPVLIRCGIIKGYERMDNRSRGGGLDSFFDMGFGSSMFRQPVTEDIIVKTEPLELEVLPLPEQGRPKDFSGAIGEFSFEASVSPTKLNLGDPVTLTMLIKGNGNIRALGAPKIENLEGFKTYEPESTTESMFRDGQYGGEKAFKQILIPTELTSNTVPAVSFSYFDPRMQNYRTVKRGPFQLEIKRSDKKTQTITAPVPSVATEQKTPEKVKILSQDIAYIKTRTPHWRKNSDTDKTFYTATAVIVLAPTLFFALLTRHRRRQHLNDNPDIARACAGAKNALLELSASEKHIRENNSTEFFNTAAPALNRFLADKLKLPYGAVTDKTISELRTHGIKPETLTAIGDFINTAEKVRFSGLSPDAEQMKIYLKNLRAFIKTADKKIKH